MRVSRFLLTTLKEAPAEADIASQRLMLRAGMIKKTSSGIYSWLPLGLIALRKVEAVVREEMNGAGALECYLPHIVPAELWQETGRWDKFGPQLLKMKDRHGRDFLFGPTHEEVVTDIVRKDIRSYRQLPLNLYQIQVKFRDEIRPRFGVMRGREFLMKDAYSFDADRDALMRSYQAMFDAYTRIFTRLGLRFRAVEADTGAIGGFASHEFQVLADAGEDAIAYCPQSDYAANVEQAEGVAPVTPRAAPQEPLQKVATPGQSTCEEVALLLGLPLARTVKCLMIFAQDKVQMLLVRGDHMGNEVKIGKLPGLGGAWRWASEAEIVDVTHALTDRNVAEDHLGADREGETVVAAHRGSTLSTRTGVAVLTDSMAASATRNSLQNKPNGGSAPRAAKPSSSRRPPRLAVHNAPRWPFASASRCVMPTTKNAPDFAKA